MERKRRIEVEGGLDHIIARSTRIAILQKKNGVDRAIGRSCDIAILRFSVRISRYGKEAADRCSLPFRSLCAIPLGFGFGGACFRDEVADLARKRRDVIRNAAGYRPLYAAGLYRFTVADLFGAGRVKDF